LFIRASSYLKKNLFNETINDCNKIMKLNPDNAGAFYIRGCAFEKLGFIDPAIVDFTKVLELDPDHVNAAYARGAAENKRGNFAKAIEDYNMALEMDELRGSKSPNLRRNRMRNTGNFILEEDPKDVQP
jgi:tetratricopeptide (TPR) repeat protein